MPRLAFTGFGPFPGVDDNPSAHLIGALRSSDDPAFAACRFDVLDTDYRTVPERLAAILGEAPRALVMLGYSHVATGLTLERGASDFCLPDRPDAAGFIPDRGAGMITRLTSRVDLAALEARLCGAGIRCALSDDAGSYVCNTSYFTALAIAAETPVLFIHIPAIAGTALAARSSAALPLDQMIRGLAITATVLAP